MLFNSISFLLFFLAVCMLYYSIPVSWLRLRNGLLLVASYWFYMSWEPAYALLLLSNTVITYLLSISIERCHSIGTKKHCVIVCIVLNLTTLFFFKYYDFAAENIRTAMQAGGLVVDLPQLGLLLPVGISFYTFQAIGYTIDVYRGTTCAESDFLTFALFVSFFPQLVAGPIERSGNLLPQFNTQHHFDYEQVMKGIRMMAWGFFTKLVVADRCGLYADAVFNNVNMHNGGSLLLATLLFSFQIYGDFAGYSLIAIGAARVLGFQLMENFHRPYFACSVTEFWHRWHVSLSTWLRDYVYIPLGGCRVGRLRHYVNLLTTFLVSGAWHGADWTFICWGSLHGLLLCIEKATGIDLRVHSCQQRIWRQVLTFVIVCLAWILFRVNNMSEMCSVITALFTRLNIPDLSFAMFTEVTAAMAAIGILLLREYADEHKWRPRIVTQFPQVASTIFLVFITASILLMGVLDGEQFIYFQF